MAKTPRIGEVWAWYPQDADPAYYELSEYREDPEINENCHWYGFRVNSDFTRWKEVNPSQIHLGSPTDYGGEGLWKPLVPMSDLPTLTCPSCGQDRFLGNDYICPECRND